MKSKFIVISLAVLFIGQWFVPSSMIWERHKVLKDGWVLKLKTAAVDPYDPFRGKFITLSYDEDSFIDSASKWTRDQTIFVTFVKDSLGFDVIENVATSKPIESDRYLKARVGSLYFGDRIPIRYGLERYYMNEDKAYDAEVAYRKANRNGLMETYALIKVNQGLSVLQAVMIEDLPIENYVSRSQNSDNK